MIVEKPFNIGRARERTQHYADQSERDIWIYNEKLKHEIEQCSFSGMNEATVDITLPKFNESGSIVNKLSDMYIKEGYDIRVDRLVNGLDTFTGYRFTVIW